MIPVYQTLTVAKDGHGNCRNACIASLLHKKIEDVPAILPNDEGDWHSCWNVWLAEQGFKLVGVLKQHPPAGYAIASITTDRVYPEGHKKAGRKIYHAVITFGDVVLHDPHPEPSKVVDIQYYEELVILTAAERLRHKTRMQQGTCMHGYRLGCTPCDDAQMILI